MQESKTYNKKLELVSKLTKQQKRFAELYVRDLNGTKAAIGAGYSKNSAGALASAALKNVNVAAYIAHLQDNLAETSGITALANLLELKKIAFGNLKDLLDDYGQLKEWDDVPDDSKATLQELIVSTYVTKDGNPVKNVRIKTHDKQRAIENINKMLNFNAPDRTEITTRDMTPARDLLAEADFTELADAEIRNMLGLSESLKVRMGINSDSLLALQRELNNRSFYEFFKYMWPELSNETLQENWHLAFLCEECQEIAERVGAGEAKAHDLLINIPPGTTKTTIVSIAFPAWCWTRWHWMRFITASYSSALALESAETCRDLIRSDRFSKMYPELEIKPDKDTKSNYKIIKKVKAYGQDKVEIGGNRYSTSVGGSVTGFHCHIFIWDDPQNPQKALSEADIISTNRWIDTVISTRKVDKTVSTTIGIMQRLHQNDPSGHVLAKGKKNLRHICLPGELNEYRDEVKPKHLVMNYRDGLLDPIRMSKDVLKEMRTDLGQYGYAGQIGQKPTPPGGGMFQVQNFKTVTHVPSADEIVRIVRYWDKAGSAATGAWTVGCKMALLKSGFFIVLDIVRGQWASHERERHIKNTAIADGKKVTQYVEQEPGSGGKESAENTVRNLAGYVVKKDLPKGDKALRADPYSVQVNEGNVFLLQAEWNKPYKDELEHFPFSTYKDQVDASSGAFAKLTTKKKARAK